ncbi:MAG TPA: biotin/lipoyl-binding protein, partial [Pseudomonas sp.]|nr:biotin/lipoyl-binding protein [Pseudomonas sp.]
MDLLLILTYTAICVAIFKIFRIPLNKWTVPTAVLGGIVLIGTLIFLMNYNHPYSEVSRSYFVSTPIVPAVSGQVVEVPVRGHQMLEKGDVLFRIDPT